LLCGYWGKESKEKGPRWDEGRGVGILSPDWRLLLQVAGVWLRL
jgi:hypothetical protein